MHGAKGREKKLQSYLFTIFSKWHCAWLINCRKSGSLTGDAACKESARRDLYFAFKMFIIDNIYLRR